MHKYTAELIGTFGLTLVVFLSLASGNAAVATPILAGLALGLFVYTLAPISGTHINPAITVGLFMINKIEVKEAVGYIVAQFVGAFLAMRVALALGATVTLTAGNTITVGVAEALGALFFGFGVAAVASGKVPESMSGIVVGGSLLFGISLASFASNGIVNPAVAFGIGSFNLMYVAGPIVGSIAGMFLFKFLSARAGRS